MKNKWRAYIKPFDDSGNYLDWIEVTDDCDLQSIGSINSDLDNTEFDIGVYRNSSFKVTLRNQSGYYSDVGTPTSIFKYKRSDSQFKITWEVEEDGPNCGFSPCGFSYLSEETELFTGLINDESLAVNLDDHKVSFIVLGRESKFLKTIVPFGSISNGDLYSEVIHACLNQENITSVLTVDIANITCGIDLAIDSIASLQNKTVQEGLNKLLLASNSVLYIDGDEVIVSPRSAGGSVTYNFYGQASDIGPENIQNIEGIKNGEAKILNYLVWKDVAITAEDSTSITKYGQRKREFDFEFVTDNTSRESILESVRDEFKDPKQEFSITTPLNTETLTVGLLDRVDFDYPTVAFPAPGEDMPICGTAVCDEAIAPYTLWSLTLDQTEPYKVLGRSIDIQDASITFRVREI